MSIEELKQNIKSWSVPNTLYSINEGLKPNAYILYENYGQWDFFYLNEKGERIDCKTFNSNSDAYNYLWVKLYKEMQYPPSFPPPSVYQ